MNGEKTRKHWIMDFTRFAKESRRSIWHFSCRQIMSISIGSSVSQSESGTTILGLRFSNKFQLSNHQIPVNSN